MPISATGHCRPFSCRGGNRPDSRGFTLMELLVGISIVAILLGAIQPVLPTNGAQAGHHAAVRAWQVQAGQASMLALQRSTPYQWEIRGQTARLLEKTPAGWIVPPDLPVAAPRTLPPDLQPVHAAQGHGSAAAAEPVTGILFYPGQAPVFDLEIVSSTHVWHIRGNPAGRVQRLEGRAEK